MSFLNQILGVYNYNYFDQHNQLQTKQLNILQCFVRKFFGCYAETHLSNVVRKGYTVSLNNDFQFTDSKKQQFLKLIAKIEEGAKPHFYLELPDYNLPTGTKVHISMRYVLSNQKNENDHFKINSIYFDFNFSFNNRVHAKHHISISKNKLQELTVYLPNQLFQGYSDDTENLIKARLNSEQATTINDFLAKIVSDSSVNHQMPDIQFYATDYSCGYKSNAFSDSSKLNFIQDKALNQLGWRYVKPYAESGHLAILERKQVYCFDKEEAAKNQNLKNSGFSQPLSLFFAVLALDKGN